MFFVSVHHTISKENFLCYMKQVLTLEAFKTFTQGSIIDKAVLCLGEKQGMLVNYECSSWHNKVGDFLMSVWDRRKEILYANGSTGEVQLTTSALSNINMCASNALFHNDST